MSQLLNQRHVGALSVSSIGLGCNNFGMRLDAAESAVVVHKALDVGINFFDTAESYGPSQEYLGKALGKRRKEVYVATKFGNRGTGAHRANILRAVEDSLRALKTDYIDLYQQHRPDPKTPVSETLETLETLKTQGKIREYGCSNFTREMLEEGHAARKGSGFVSVQNEYSLFHRAPESDGVLDFCVRERVGMLPYFPLANGMLTGKYRAGRPKPEGTRISEMEGFAGSYTPERVATVERLIAFAEARGHTILELAFSFLLAHSAVSSVIAGATSAAQVEANAGAGNWVLGREDLSALELLLTP